MTTDTRMKVAQAKISVDGKDAHHLLALQRERG